MKINHIDNITAFEDNPVFQGKRIFDKDFCQIVHLTVKKDNELQKHSASMDVFFYVLEGKGKIITNNSEEDLYTGIILDVPANEEHIVKNTDNIDLKILVIKFLNTEK